MPAKARHNTRTLTAIQQRKGTFQPTEEQLKHVAGLAGGDADDKLASVLSSNQNTDGSSVNPKKDDNRTSYKSQINVNLFDVNVDHNDADDINDAPRSNFFDLAHFGPTKKRSSTDPGKILGEDDKKSALNAFSDNQTQTISENAMSAHQSILLTETRNKHDTYNKFVPEMDDDGAAGQPF